LIIFHGKVAELMNYCGLQRIKMELTEKPVRVKRDLNGLFLLDKPSGVSSNQALQKVKWLLRAKKAGHTGTLDPLATGLLPICLGEATKFSRFQLEANKRYRVTARFGAVSDTGDLEGEIVSTGFDVPADEDTIRDLLPQFVGKISQRPPVYSAIKVDGRRLCDYARGGIDIEPKLRQVEVSQFDLTDFTGVEATFEISCSKGTYIRSLVVDLGAALECGAHVIQLRRLAAGNLGIGQAVSLSDLESIAGNDDQVLPKLLPTETLVEGLGQLNVSAEQATRLKGGQIVSVDPPAVNQAMALFSSGRFIGVGELDADGSVRPRRMMQH